MPDNRMMDFISQFDPCEQDAPVYARGCAPGPADSSTHRTVCTAVPSPDAREPFFSRPWVLATCWAALLVLALLAGYAAWAAAEAQRVGREWQGFMR